MLIICLLHILSLVLLLRVMKVIETVMSQQAALGPRVGVFSVLEKGSLSLEKGLGMGKLCIVQGLGVSYRLFLIHLC